MSKTIYTEQWVEVAVDLSEISTEDLQEELISRNKIQDTESIELITVMWEKYRTNQSIDHEITQLIYHSIGKIV